jgi:hypothetical protein
VRSFVDFLAERYRQEGILAPEKSINSAPPQETEGNSGN